jgi:Icc-related predicted phosphoesterase
MHIITRRQFLAVAGAVSALPLVGSTSADVNTSLPRFAVISDIHIENHRGEGARVKVPKALKNLLGKTPKADAVFVVGDLTQDGTAEEYDTVFRTFNDKNLVPEGVAVYYLTGNHDVIGDGKKHYLEKLGQPLHQYIDVKGYPFITISMNSPDWRSPQSYSEESQQFLAEKMKDAAQKYPEKPIFVFCHLPPKDTCYGSWNWGTTLFLPTLEKYPQAVVFAGHAHLSVADPRSIHQDKFTSINDGSTTYCIIAPNEKLSAVGQFPENNDYVTEGLIAAVLPNGNVEIERWDTYRNEEIFPRWTVKAPFDGSQFTYKNRNDVTVPVFADGAKPKVAVAKKSVEVTFPQAKDNEVVHHYVVEILDGDKVVTNFTKFSQFYLTSEMPKELSVKFNDLPAGELTVAVTAVDSYGNKSEKIRSKPFNVG